MVVDNPTNQWVRLDSLGIAIPQYTLGATYPMPGSTRARFSFTAPLGQTEPPTIAGQTLTVRFFDLALPLTAGVGMLGGRAPYYDRNPLSVVRQAQATSAAGDGSVQMWTYTVPAGRKAYLEEISLLVQIRIAFASDDQNLGTSISYVTGVMGVPTVIGAASIWVGTLAGTIATLAIGASIELQSGETIATFSDNARAVGAGSAKHRAAAKFTEFDA